MKTDKEINADYIKDQFSQLKPQETFLHRLKISGHESETKWLSVTLDQINKIREILIN